MAGMYESPGTENLRANQQIFGPSAPEENTGGGTDVGGTANLKAQAQVLTGPAKQAGKGSDNIPALTFKDGVV